MRHDMIMRFCVAIYVCYEQTISHFGLQTSHTGCVGAELLLGQPLFPGDSGVDQLVEIIKVRFINLYLSVQALLS